MARSDVITRLEVATCPTHRQNVGHYKDHEVGCDCLTEERRADLTRRLQEARDEGHPLADPAE
jgi:hypothetical protein